MDNMVPKVQVETTMSQLSKITDGLKQRWPGTTAGQSRNGICDEKSYS
jgi:hypothetical protein